MSRLRLEKALRLSVSEECCNFCRARDCSAGDHFVKDVVVGIWNTPKVPSVVLNIPKSSFIWNLSWAYSLTWMASVRASMKSLSQLKSCFQYSSFSEEVSGGSNGGKIPLMMPLREASCLGDSGSGVVVWGVIVMVVERWYHDAFEFSKFEIPFWNSLPPMTDDVSCLLLAFLRWHGGTINSPCWSNYSVLTTGISLPSLLYLLYPSHRQQECWPLFPDEFRND